MSEPIQKLIQTDDGNIYRLTFLEGRPKIETIDNPAFREITNDQEFQIALASVMQHAIQELLKSQSGGDDAKPQ